MRIERLDLMAYGAFTDTCLDLSAGAAGLHLIYGDNEAGKSTSLRAIIAWLFGIPARTTDNYLHTHTQLRIGGKLSLSNGGVLEFIRRKGSKGTLLGIDGNDTLADDILLPFLPEGLDETLFKTMYGIDHARLEEGGKELLNQSGDVGQALFSAALGIGSPRAVLASLQAEADELFKSRASTKRVNQAVADFRDAKKRVKEFSLPVTEWNHLKTELADTLGHIRQVEEQIHAKNKEKSRLERLNRVKGTLAERRATLNQLKDVENVLLLPENFEEQCKTVNNRLQVASETREKAAAKLTVLQEEIRSLDVRDELLAREAEILDIYKNLGAVETAIQDRPSQDGQRRLLRNEASNLLKAVRSDIGIDDADNLLRPLLKKKNWVADLAKKHGLLIQRMETANRNRQNAEDDKQANLVQLAGQHPRPTLDVGALKTAVATTRKSGDIEGRLSEARQRAADSKAAADNAFHRLGRFTGTVETLLHTAMPVPETLDHFEKQFQEITENIRDYSRQYKELEAEKAQAVHDLDALLLKSDAPTLAQLQESRASRNQLWHSIKQHYIDGDTRADSDWHAAGAEIPILYEQQVDDADHLADRLRLEADQVVKRADLEAKGQMLDSRLAQLLKRLDQANALQQHTQQAWENTWSPLGIEAGTPREMKQWAARVENLLSSFQSANAMNEGATNLAREYEAHRQAISTQIAKFTPAAELQGMGLEALLEMCEQRLAQEEQMLNQEKELRQALKDTESRISKAQESIKLVEDDLAVWVQEWNQAIEGLGVKPDVHPEYAVETLEQLVMFFDKLDASEEKRRRIYGIDKVKEEFDKKVFTFVDGITFGHHGQGASIIAEQLHQNLNEAREARAKLEKIKDAEKAENAIFRDADISFSTASEQLSALKKQANVADDVALVKAGEESRRKRGLQQKLEALEQELTRNGDGLTIEALEQEADSSDIDAVEGGIQQVSIDLSELLKQRDEWRDQRQTLQNRIDAKDGNAAAANAAEEAEQHLASIAAGAEQYLRLKIAALILGQQIEAYRKQNQAPVLARAGSLFARLTLGSYAGLRDELGDGDKPILLGVRPDNTEVLVDKMSDGTRTQLYLSLRLATLEQHLCNGEPIPFVVDDILINFDDHRTKASLEVLAEVAEKTQVLLFTHHRRVIDLAATITARAGIYTHELGYGNRTEIAVL